MFIFYNLSENFERVLAASLSNCT